MERKEEKIKGKKLDVGVPQLKRSKRKIKLLLFYLQIFSN